MQQADETGVSFRAMTIIAMLLGITVGSFILRALFVGEQSAFMDEKSYILIGRYLIEQQRDHFNALEWVYGFYLWPILAGFVDIWGGLTAVRLVTSAFGVVSVLMTALTALWIAPRSLSSSQRWLAALIAGGFMAVFPTAIAVGRLGTYDAMAAAAFMTGIALLVRAQNGRSWLLLAGTIAVFVAFLTKYIVAVFFPFICIYLMVKARSRSDFARTIGWLVMPLSAACAGYFLLFRADMLALISHAMETSTVDLRSDTPLREYVWQRPELWVLGGLAALGWKQATRFGREVAFGGAAVLVGFQLITRADFDFWKHSIYVIYFLAPPAGLALASWIERVLVPRQHTARSRPRWQTIGSALIIALLLPLVSAGIFISLDSTIGLPSPASDQSKVALVFAIAIVVGITFAPLVERITESAEQRTEPWSKWRTAGLILPVVMIVLLVTTFSVAEADRLATSYPNLNSSIAEIRQHTDGAQVVLTDDSAVGYYLYPDVEFVYDPFFIEYEGHQGMEGYRRAINDQYFDVIVFDGGIGPFAQEFNSELTGLINQEYERVYQEELSNGSKLEIYRPAEVVLEPLDDRSNVYRFDTGLQGWGSRIGSSDFQAGAHVSTSDNQTLSGYPTLEFKSSEPNSMVSVSRLTIVAKMTVWIYIPTIEGGDSEVLVGMVGFDHDWQWHDDEFQNFVPTGRWHEISWDLSDPGVYNELGLFFPEPLDQPVYLAHDVAGAVFSGSHGIAD
jgi:hypothetical protein